MLIDLSFVVMWGSRLLIDTEEIIILQYEKFKLFLHIKDLDIRLKVRCEICGKNRHSDYCKGHCSEKERKNVINIDYNSELENMLDEFLMSNQVSFDKFELQCGDLVEKANECQKKLFEVEMKRHVIMVQAEHLKNKSTNIEEKPHVRHVDLYLTIETQSMEMEEIIHLQK
jgi:hypothetical protein